MQLELHLGQRQGELAKQNYDLGFILMVSSRYSVELKGTKTNIRFNHVALLSDGAYIRNVLRGRPDQAEDLSLRICKSFLFHVYMSRPRGLRTGICLFSADLAAVRLVGMVASYGIISS